MLLAELSKDIDNKWDECWPVNTLRPLVLIDCISYILFFKKLEDDKLISHSQTEPDSRKVFYLNDSQELSWNHIKDLDSKSLYTLFNKENGIADLLKSYSNTNLPYSTFLKPPLLIKPSGVLLFNIVEIIKIIESQNDFNKGAIFEYLIHKGKIQTSLGQEYAPPDVIHAIVSVINPSADEVICDPSCGNGDLLVNIMSYFSKKNNKLTIDQLSKTIVGLDNDPIQLRIAAMNLILHGIEEPRLSVLDAEENFDFVFRNKAVLVLSNLYFTDIEQQHNDLLVSERDCKKRDINLLNIILKNLTGESRAAVIVRNYILDSNILPEAKSLRQQLIDNYKVDAIISLPGREGSFFSGASILIFHLSKSADTIWFYKMKPSSHTSNYNIVNVNGYLNGVMKSESSETAVYQSLEDNHANGKIVLTESFCVSAGEVRNNNYSLDINQYKKKIFLPQQEVTVQKLTTQLEKINPETVTATKFLVKKINRFKNSGIEKLQKATTLFSKKVNKTILTVHSELQKLNAGKSLMRETLIIISVTVFALAFSFSALFFSSKPKTLSGKTKKINPVPAITNTAKKQTKILTRQQIKSILEDTSGIIHVEDFASNTSDSLIESLASTVLKNKTVSPKNKKHLLVTPASTRFIKHKYKVLDTTYFHDKPDKQTARNTYLDPHKKAVLTSLGDSNGFIYIVYTNKTGITSKGWINKKDLTEVQQ